ncbi:MAG: 2-succinyl-5-enolpyruvyl-6-hydroxy-3-cyclohexene-1-carboxylic-acid synthase [Actinomycetota bacterium]
MSVACARTLVDELARAGLRVAVLAPGSRSAPMALALAHDERIELHVLLDERSAAFFALGAAKASGRPTLVLCTSGTAAAHFHPAVLEADHSRVPLIVCTADRPAELRDTGAPQTTDQVHLYGPAVRFFAEIPADGHPAARAAWRPVAARLWAEAAGPPAGPVHLNVAFREPLVPTAGKPAASVGGEAAPGVGGEAAPGVGGEAAPGVGGESAAEISGESAAGVGGALVAGVGGDTAAGQSLAAPERSEEMEPGREAGRPWATSFGRGPARLSAAVAAELEGRIAGARRGLVVAGWGSPAEAAEVAARLRWPLLADAISGQRGSDGAITTYEALLRVPGFAERHRPDLVIRFGGPLTSKTAMVWLDASVPQILVDPDGAWLDPGRAAAERVPSLPDLGRRTGRDPEDGEQPGSVASGSAVEHDVAAIASGSAAAGHNVAIASGAAAERDVAAIAWYEAWGAAEKAARAALDAFLDSDDQPFEGRVARDVAAVCADDRRRPALVVASSMPVRDLEAFAGRTPERVYANRGVNGIDGLVSTVLGVAAGSNAGSAEPARRPVVGLLGDLAFLHDAGGLLGAPQRGLDAVFVVVDNGGGGIFSFLPQAALPPERFELLFGTPPGADVAEVAKAYGLPAERVERAGEVGPALERALAAGGVRVLIVPTGDRTANVDRHRQAWAAVGEAIAKSTG